MKNKLALATILLGGLALATACNKENNNEILGIPEGAIRLTAEGYQSDQKTSVDGYTVEWRYYDQVRLNAATPRVIVDGDNAYVNGLTLSGTVYGYYPHNIVGENTTDWNTATPTVTIPASYSSYIDDGRQVIALPMVGTANAGDATITFHHLTAAVNVMIWNATGNTLSVDRVVVKVPGYRLHGSVSLDFTDDNLGLASSYTPSTNADSEVEVTFAVPLEIANDENNVKSVQVPFLPIGSSSQLTIEIYSHQSGIPLHTYTYSHAASTNALGRNMMLTAYCKMHTGEGNHVTEVNPLANPLTFEAKVAGATVTFSSGQSGATLQYSTDCTSWTNYTGPITLTNVGDKVFFRGDNQALGTNDDANCSNFSCDGDCYLYGNVMSLLYPTSFPTAASLPDEYTFYCLFKNNTHIFIHPTEPLVLPATTLKPYCYKNMFSGCTRLTTLPATLLPATQLANYCYEGMFSGCTSLTTLPATLLPARQLTNYCYEEMFSGCTGLTTLPATLLPATYGLTLNCYKGMFSGCTSLTTLPDNLLRSRNLNKNCYQQMFSGCTGLTTLPATLLPSTHLYYYCYERMFENCTSLTTLPATLLPATRLEQYCYQGMFSGCTGLTTLPDNLLPATSMQEACYKEMFSGCTGLYTLPANLLPATTLENGCYYKMFANCESLPSAPDLPAPTLKTHCYAEMFYNCGSLSSVKCLATDNVNQNYSTQNWLYGVEGEGTFYADNASVNWVSGSSGIPDGWNRVNVN